MRSNQKLVISLSTAMPIQSNKSQGGDTPEHEERQHHTDVLFPICYRGGEQLYAG